MIQSTDLYDTIICLKTVSELHHNAMIVFITHTNFTSEEWAKINSLKMKKQVIKTPMDDYALSNAVIKCLTNLGGKVAILDDMMCPKDTYFIGIDMGHRYDHKNAAESYTQLVMSLIDTAVTIITSKSVSSLPLNEALSLFATINILNQIKNTISKINRKMPKKLIFHRDGKVHVDDVQIILQSVKQVFGIEDIEIIEIIKSGHPYVTEYLNSPWHNRPSGSAWIVPSKNYAIYTLHPGYP